MIDQHESVLKSISNCIRECWVLYKSYKNAGETFKQITSKGEVSQVHLTKNELIVLSLVRRLWASLQEFHNDLRFSGFISISGNNEIWDVWSTWTTELKYKIHEREVAMVNYRSLQAMQTIGPWGRNMSLLTPEYETKIIAEIDTETNETIANINTISSERNKIESEESNTGGQILQDIKLKLESIYQDIVEGKKDPSYVDTVDRDTLKKELMEDNVTEADFELNKDTIQEWLSRVQQNKEFTEEQTRKSQPARPFSPELYSSSLTSSPHIAPRDVTLERLTPIDEVRSISMDEGVTPAFRYESGTAYTVYSYDDDRSDILGQIGIKEVSEPDVQELSSDSKGDEARSGLKNTSPAATALGQVPHQSVNLKQTKYSKGGSLSVSNATLDSGNKMAEVNTDDNKPRGANEFKEAEDSDTLIYRNQKSWDVDPNSSTNSSLSAPGLAPGVTSRTFALSTPDKDILSGPTRHGVDSGPPRSSPEYSRINIEYLDVTDPRCKPSEYVQVTTFTPMLHNLFVNTEIFLTRSRFIHRADLQMKDHESGIDWHGDIKKVWNNLQIPLKRGIRDGMRVVLVGQGDYIDGGYKDLHVVMKPVNMRTLALLCIPFITDRVQSPFPQMSPDRGMIYTSPCASASLGRFAARPSKCTMCLTIYHSKWILHSPHINKCGFDGRKTA